ncbi:MAG TPA: hypothetical protein VL360_05065 [Gammaproteobacteria bacterium]|jgi:hypothetical protein|nr:hypothetical protein [Gammaproteobacteria bacterium]
MRLKSILNYVIFAISLFLQGVASAARPTGLGGVANNIMDPVGVASDFIYTGSIVIGGSFVFAAIVKYFDHRRSPLMVPISTVVFLFIAGVVLLMLPLLSYINANGIPYSLFG